MLVRSTVLKRNTKLKERLNPTLAVNVESKIIPLITTRNDDSNKSSLGVAAEERSSYGEE